MADREQSRSDGLSDILRWLGGSDDGGIGETLEEGGSTSPVQAPTQQSASVVGPEPLPKVFGRYRVLRCIGVGQFGSVYLASDDSLARRVAIKVAHPERLSTPSARQAYRNEAKILAQLDGVSSIPKVYDWGEVTDGPCYLVTEFIEGKDLKEQLNERSFSPIEAALIVAKLADSLHEAHKQRLVHRDIKPANVLLREDGDPVIVDFGLALRDEDVHAGTALAGTAAYMSPEQVNMRSNAVDGRADIYALGALLYQMLTGQLPIRGKDTATLVEQITTIDPKPPRQHSDAIPPALEAVCLKALSKDPADRFQTGRDFATALRQSVAEKNRSRIPLLLIAATSIAILVAILQGTSHVQEPQITRFVVEHLDRSGETPRPAGNIGDDFMPKFVIKDSVRLQVELAIPSYVTIYSLSPNGQVERCFPVDGDKVETTSSLRYPMVKGDVWTVNDVGAQAFLALASAKRPSGLEEIEKQIAQRWGSVAQNSIHPDTQRTDDGYRSTIGRWLFDGEQFEPLPDHDASRSLESGAFGVPPRSFVDVCKLFDDRDEFDLRAVLFEVTLQP